MNLLLDSNIIIAILRRETSSLPVAMQQALTAKSAQLLVSVASIWEIAIKVRLGKLDTGSPLDRLPDLCRKMPATILGIEVKHVMAEPTPLPATRDPFDRLLLAQAQVESVRLVTIDQALAEHPLAWR